MSPSFAPPRVTPVTPVVPDDLLPGCLARVYFDANCRALDCRALGAVLSFPGADFCLGRDGSLTAKCDGQWLGGCSVPRRAAEAMLRTTHWTGPVICLLLPTHGQQVAACLDRLGPPHGLVVLMRSTEALAGALACCDFAGAIADGRLFFAVDADGLRRVFADHPGLAVPTQLVRLPDADPADIAEATKMTQAMFTALAGDHAGRTKAAATTDAGPSADWCVLAPQHFRLWNDAGRALDRACGGRFVDTDRPTTAADAHAAEAAAGAAAVVTADRGRAAWARHDRPWVTWVTRGRVPAFDPAAPRDALVLADPAWTSAARDAGWPAARVAVAGWPADPIAHAPGAPLALIADLADLEPPAEVSDLSARRVVWEAIREELIASPFALGDDARRYVERAPGRLNMTLGDDFPVDPFVDTLVAPAFLLGVARWLVRQGVPLTLHGRGWAAYDDLAGHVRGPIADRMAFRAAVASSGGLVDAFVGGRRAIGALAVPVVRCFGRTPSRVLQDTLAVRAGRFTAEPGVQPLTRGVVEALLR